MKQVTLAVGMMYELHFFADFPESYVYKWMNHPLSFLAMGAWIYLVYRFGRYTMNNLVSLLLLPDFFHY